MKIRIIFVLLVTGLVLWSCKQEENAFVKASKTTFSVPFEKFELENGLTVVLHKDTSDPVVALSLIHI